MKINFIGALLLVGASAVQIESYPYYQVSGAKKAAITAAGGNAELEPLETGSMKTLPNLRELKANLLKDGFKEKAADPSSVEAAIKKASRNHGAEEQKRIADINAREVEQLKYAVVKAHNIGVNQDPTFRG